MYVPNVGEIRMKDEDKAEQQSFSINEEVAKAERILEEQASILAEGRLREHIREVALELIKDLISKGRLRIVDSFGTRTERLRLDLEK